jgi:hypothetical protein
MSANHGKEDAIYPLTKVEGIMRDVKVKSLSQA